MTIVKVPSLDLWWKGLKGETDRWSKMLGNFLQVMKSRRRRSSLPSLFIIFPILLLIYLDIAAATKRSRPTHFFAAANNLRDADIRYLSLNTSARCIDGSAPAYYIRKGSGDGARKWIVFFEGGGWCYDLKQCFLRSKTRLGTTKNTPPKLFSYELGFYISEQPSVNPMMYNWNTVYVRYCDGSSFAGDATVMHGVSSIVAFKSNSSFL